VLSPPKQLDIRWWNLACRCVTTLSYIWAGSFVDWGHRWEENVTFNLQLYIKLQERHIMPSRWWRHCYDYVINADQCRMSVAAGLWTFTYSTPLCVYKAQTERAARHIFMGWSAQRNKHGAFKLKLSEARFQLVILYFPYSFPLSLSWESCWKSCSKLPFLPSKKSGRFLQEPRCALGSSIFATYIHNNFLHPHC